MEKNIDHDDFHKIKVFSSEDEKLKILGELLSNKSSRDIIKLLIEKETYINEIAKKLDLKVSLVIHHLQKMESIGLLEINRKKIIRKGNYHKYYRVNPGFVIFPSESNESIEKRGILNKVFKETIKFTCLVIAAGIAFLLTGGLRASEFGEGDLPSAREISPITYAMIVFSIGLLIFYFVKKKRKR